jgi:hypothetical protein
VAGLAEHYPMSFAAVQKHIAIFERAGIVTKERIGRRKIVRTNPKGCASLVACSTSTSNFGAGGSSDQGWKLYSTWMYRSIKADGADRVPSGLADAEGNNKAPAELGLPSGIPNEIRHVVPPNPIGDATRTLTVREFGYPNVQTVEISQAGMEQCLDNDE